MYVCMYACMHVCMYMHPYNQFDWFNNNNNNNNNKTKNKNKKSKEKSFISPPDHDAHWLTSLCLLARPPHSAVLAPAWPCPLPERPARGSPRCPGVGHGSVTARLLALLFSQEVVGVPPAASVDEKYAEPSGRVVEPARHVCQAHSLLVGQQAVCNVRSICRFLFIYYYFYFIF